MVDPEPPSVCGVSVARHFYRRVFPQIPRLPSTKTVEPRVELQRAGMLQSEVVMKEPL
jgi:hypothetical protein